MKGTITVTSWIFLVCFAGIQVFTIATFFGIIICSDFSILTNSLSLCIPGFTTIHGAKEYYLTISRLEFKVSKKAIRIFFLNHLNSNRGCLKSNFHCIKFVGLTPEPSWHTTLFQRPSNAQNVRINVETTLCVFRLNLMINGPGKY